MLDALDTPVFFYAAARAWAVWALLLAPYAPDAPIDVVIFWFLTFCKFFAFRPSFDVVIDPGVFFDDIKFLPCFYAPTYAYMSLDCIVDRTETLDFDYSPLLLG